MYKDIVYEPILEFNIICDYKDGRFDERTFSHTWSNVHRHGESITAVLYLKRIQIIIGQSSCVSW